MNDQKESELHKEDTGIEIPALTSKPKKVLFGILMGLFISYLLINIFWDKPKKETIKNQNDVATDVNFYPAPKIQDSHDEKVRSINPDKPALANNAIEENPETKLIMLRQHAPIQMFIAESEKIQMQQAEDRNVENQTVTDMPKINTTSNSETSAYSANTSIALDSGSNSNPSLDSSSDKNGQVVQLKHQDWLLLEGTIIPGILQTALHSDLSGNLKAQVTEDVYASRGHRILIPKGSILLGHYSGNTSQQQSRIFVVWTRIIRIDGVSIKLQAEGTDELGQAGLSGNVNHHYIARFGQASLLSLLGAGIASSQISPNENYSLALANSFTATSKDSLQDSTHIKPTITIKAGTPVAVYVNQDISFYSFHFFCGKCN
jgi:type IV secretion system protein VirB10